MLLIVVLSSLMVYSDKKTYKEYDIEITMSYFLIHNKNAKSIIIILLFYK
jgi:hypothetical protein